MLREALDLAVGIEDRDNRARALDYLAPELPAPWLREALTAVETIGDKDRLDKALAWLAPLRNCQKIT